MAALPFRIGHSQLSEIGVLRKIQRLSGEQFREVRLDDVADAELISADTYRSYIEDQRA